ncbi:hypothetical protein E5288_WYG009483 [Bos mutus]|uniref:Uncharacterized protein n=1 Tax=Bos mutus TaxID=72004 RepID=A0A6B0RNW8_9CETA|nr:hypothetical protein [Bos mutus]
MDLRFFNLIDKPVRAENDSGRSHQQRLPSFMTATKVAASEWDTAGACDQPIAPALMRTDPAKNNGDAWLGAERLGSEGAGPQFSSVEELIPGFCPGKRKTLPISICESVEIVSAEPQPPGRSITSPPESDVSRLVTLQHVSAHPVRVPQPHQPSTPPPRPQESDLRGLAVTPRNQFQSRSISDEEKASPTPGPTALAVAE